MTLLDTVRISLKMLWMNRLRSILTIFGIAIAIAFLVMLTGAGYGLQSLTIGSIVHSESLLSLDLTAPTDSGLTVTPALLNQLQQSQSVAAVSPVVVVAGQVSYGGKLASTGITAATPQYLDMAGVTVPTGRAYALNQSELVITPAVLSLLDIPSDKAVGTVVKLVYDDPANSADTKSVDTVTIVGVATADATPSVYVPTTIFGTQAVPLSGIKLLGRDRSAVITLQHDLVGQGYQVASTIETLDQAQTIFQWVTVGLVALGSIALIVASIGMFNTLTITLLERTREIGVMKAIGVTNRAILLLFLAEATSMGVLGGLAGIVLGLLVNQVLNSVLNVFAKAYGGTAVSVFAYPGWLFLSMLAFAVFLSILTGLYPARRASRLNALDALRYE